MIEPIWRAELIKLIDQARDVAQQLRTTPNSSEPNGAMLETTLCVLDRLRQKTINCHLPPPNGRTTLGIARGVTDFVEDLDGTLVQAAGAIERHYLTVPLADPRYPPLPDWTRVEIFADGSTKPAIPDGQAIVTIQDKAIILVGIWRRGDSGGQKESPVNEGDLIPDAYGLAKAHAPQYLDGGTRTVLICPAELTDRMVWPDDQLP
jgi:hypothetical protein